MSAFESRWLGFTPEGAKSLQTPENQTDKTDKSLGRVTPDQANTTLPRLPWKLERLLSAAGSDVLAAELPGVPDVPRWGCSYLTGDRDEALRRLWAVYRAWRGVN